MLFNKELLFYVDRSFNKKFCSKNATLVLEVRFKKSKWTLWKFYWILFMDIGPCCDNRRVIFGHFFVNILETFYLKTVSDIEKLTSPSVYTRKLKDK